MPKRSLDPSWIASAAVLAATAAFGFAQARVGLNLDDEGLLCDYAARLLRGQVPYVDFVPPYSLGRYWTVAGGFALFGESVVVARALFLAALAVAAVFTHRIALRLLPGGWALVPPALLVAIPGPVWKLDIPFALCAAALASLRYAEAPSARRAALCGAVIGLIALDRPDLPVFACAMLLAARGIGPACRGRPVLRDAATVAGAALVAVSPMLAYFAARPDAVLGLVDAVSWMTRIKEGMGIPFVAPWKSPLGVFNGALFYAGPLLALVAAVVVVRRAARKEVDASDTALAVLAVAAVLIWNQVRIRANWGHAQQATWPVWVLGPALCWRAARLVPGVGRSIAAAVLVLGLWSFVAWQAVLASPVYPGLIAIARGKAVRSGWPRADVWLPPRLKGEFGTAIDLVRGAGGPVLVLPYGPMLNFLADVQSPTFLDNLLPGRLDEAGERRVIDDLESSATPLIVHVDQESYGDLRAYLPRLVAHVELRYRMAERVGSFQMYRRK